MIDKSLVKKRFTKSLKTYNNNAIVQKEMAQRLIELLPQRVFDSVFEIGCATGILTEKLVKSVKFKEFTGNDLIEQSKDYIDKIVTVNRFITGDIEEIKLKKKYDLIISNAALQWCENPKEVIKKLIGGLKKHGILAVSIFSNDNYKEIKSVLNIRNSMQTDLTGIEETYTLYFNTPIDVLKHIKSTGTNALTEFKFTKSSLKKFEEDYKKLFSKEGKVYLTYKPLYIIRAA